MRAHTRRRLLQSGAAFVGLGALSGQSVAASYRGVTVELDAATQSERLSTVRELASAQPLVDVPEHAALFHTEDSTYIVAASDPIETGAAAVNGTELVNPAGPSAIVADSVAVNTHGPDVAYDDLVANPESYHAQIARVQTNYGQIALSVDAGDGLFTGQFALGAQSSGVELTPPGDVGVWAAGLAEESGAFDQQALQERLGNGLDDLRFVDTAGLSFWSRGETSVDVVIVREGGQTVAHVANRSFGAVQPGSIAGIQSGAFDGATVGLEADALEARVSTAEVLENVLPCGPDAFTIGTGCLPSNVDAVAHAGVLYDSVPPDENDLLLYVALSNAQQNSPVSGRHSTVRVVGDVVSTTEIHPELPEGRALVAYDVEYEGDDLPAPPDAVTELKDRAVDAIRAQIESAARGDGDSDGGDSTGSDGGSTDAGGGSDGSDGGSSGGGPDSDSSSAGGEPSDSSSQTGDGAAGGGSNSTQSSSDPPEASAQSTWAPLATGRAIVAELPATVLGAILLASASVTLLGSGITTEVKRGYDESQDRESRYTIYHSIWLATLGGFAASLAFVIRGLALRPFAYLVSFITLAPVAAVGWRRLRRSEGPTIANKAVIGVAVGQFVVVTIAGGVASLGLPGGVLAAFVLSLVGSALYIGYWVVSVCASFLRALDGGDGGASGATGRAEDSQEPRSKPNDYPFDDTGETSTSGPEFAIAALAVLAFLAIVVLAAVSLEAAVVASLVAIVLVLLAILYQVST